MIYIYTKKHGAEETVMQNDWFFNLYTGNQPITEEDMKIMEEIDHAKLTDDYHIETKYGLGVLRNLSTGCKTLLNLAKNRDKIINIDECGRNVVDRIFTMDGSRIYMTKPSRATIAEGTRICFDDSETVTGQSGYEAWWTSEYERRNRDDI